jgi:aminoglycoside phosphotransferase (APT) family kinase protein
LPAFPQTHTQEWLRYFARAGFPEVEPLAAGMEGAIYRLGGGTIAKVWGNKGRHELAAMQRFYADVAAADLPFATPVISAVEEVNGAAVTYERELVGKPLQRRLSVDDPELDPVAVDCLITALKALATVRCTDNMRELAVLDEDQPFWRDAAEFPAALANLLQRRMSRFGPLLQKHVPDFDRRFDLLTRQLNRIPPIAATAIHGDLFGENILVDPTGHPTAVLDFGFLTTGGDPRLDAAISAAIANMYGKYAADITRALTIRFADALDCPVEVLVLYQAAYAVATSNAFTDDGRDGHFAWCIARLTSPEVGAALSLF